MMNSAYIHSYVGMLHFNTSDQGNYIEGYKVPSQPGHYNDIALCTGHYNIAREDSSLICRLKN